MKPLFCVLYFRHGVNGRAKSDPAGISVSYGDLVLKDNFIDPNTTGNWHNGYGGGALNPSVIEKEDRSSAFDFKVY